MPGWSELSYAEWRKSKFSAEQGNCVEVAGGFSGVLPNWDSKDPDGPTLVFPADAWSRAAARSRTRSSTDACHPTLG
ncbi:DUF397 domain-containing protein [Streptomyces sp. CB01881]|uniref:DUF397 domain-containing protein n=1 Tax=Streptomyces sp. CB01881 TaxID=2078691 RepID=UPI000CDBA5ED|nr:DUF397 domain-containing protein [Streptomyces sp. CB01881]AUY49497.1 DUF397 domain-containing protein [Streptomyces sp. CB01881]TYC72880.1 DUF397 domain-containing protein [Streptomyces sp. CB01881]